MMSRGAQPSLGAQPGQAATSCPSDHKFPVKRTPARVVQHCLKSKVGFVPTNMDEDPVHCSRLPALADCAEKPVMFPDEASLSLEAGPGSPGCAKQHCGNAGHVPVDAATALFLSRPSKQNSLA